jgi:hypothetical protein
MVYLVYAQDQATISPAELAARHDFGLELNRDGARQAALWAVPTDTVATGVPRHLLGSLFSIDITLAAQALRSLSTGAPTAPTLVWTDRDRFSQSVALLNPFSLRNEQRDAIVGAIRRGQERVRASADDVPAFDALADEIALDGWRRGAAHWHIVNDRKELLSLFSLYELLLLGGGGAAPPHNWGPAHLSLTSCQCAHFTPPNYWRLLAGRPSVGSLSATVPDVTLMVAVSLRDLNLPAALARVIMSAAMHDFLSQVRPNDADDWLALVRTAQTIRRERIEDYVAVATSNGLLRPDSSAAGGAR